MKAGDRVQFLDDVDKGVVLSMHGDVVTVRWDSGFEEEVPKESLIKLSELFNTKLDSEDYIKEEDQRKSSQSDSSMNDIMEIDLHANALFYSVAGLSNHEILTKQISKLKESFENARKNKVKRLIVIHGVGKGRLKEEVEHFLNACTGINYFDASFKEYGQGATEVEFYKYS